ncbi:MAG: DNA-binding response regulator [Chloroflexi bacterium]|nr:MAG: DNA-binding response regulator [Chloroflexota bacterium]
MQTIQLIIFDQHSPVVDALKIRLAMEDSLEILYAGPYQPDFTLNGETAVISLLGLTSGRNINPKQTKKVVAHLKGLETAVIVLAPYINETERELALAAGASRYLLKTINTKELIGEITAVYNELNTFI